MDSKINITDKEKSLYHKDGYILISDFFNKSELGQLKKWSEEIFNWPTSTGRHLNYYEMVNGEKMLSRTEAFLPYHEKFNALINSSSIFNIVEQILGEPVFLFKEKINYKYSGTGHYPPHQDLHAAKKSPLAFQPYHCNCMILIDDANKENGCLNVSPGYNGQFLDTNADGSIKEEIVNDIVFFPLEAKAGSVYFSNMFIPHWSALNTSSNPRRTVFLTFNGKSKGDFRELHYEDRAKNLGKTIEINPDLFVE